MKKFLIGLVVGIVLCGLTLLIIGLALMRLGERRPTLADGSTLVIKLEGEVPERAPVELPLPFLEAQTPVTVREVWDTLRKATVDPRIKAVVFMPRGLVLGWGKLQEIHADLLKFRNESHKPLVAYLHNPGGAEYYLATAADRIYMTQEDMLDVKGLRVEAMFVSKTLDKLGVKADVVHAGKYKDAGDMFTRTSMTPETREVLDNILDQYYGDLIRTIAEGRKKSSETVRALIDQGPFLAKDALAAGLVDTLAYEDQMYDDLKARLRQAEIKKFSYRDYLKVPEAGAGAARRRIALLVGSGTIVRAESSDSLTSDSLLTSGEMIKLMRQVEDDSSIRGVILRIDSPGGDGIASDDILHEARALSRRKPVVISMSDLAASGGYFMAMTGDPIVAYPNTLTGSIGVIYASFNLHGLYDKLGIQKQALSRGRFANIDSEYEPMTDAERAKVTESVDAFYQGFLSRVAAGRRMKVEQVQTLAQGRVWLGEQARQNGLVDSLGGIDTAIELVKKKAQIPAGEKVTLVPYPQRRSLFDYLFNRPDDSSLLETRLRTLLRGFPIDAWTRGGYLKVMPFGLDVRW